MYKLFKLFAKPYNSHNNYNIPGLYYWLIYGYRDINKSQKVLAMVKGY